MARKTMQMTEFHHFCNWLCVRNNSTRSIQIPKVLWFDWCCQYSGIVHENLSIMTRCSFSPCTCQKNPGPQDYINPWKITIVYMRPWCQPFSLIAEELGCQPTSDSRKHNRGFAWWRHRMSWPCYNRKLPLSSVYPPTLGGQENIDLRNASTMELAHSVYQQSLCSSYHAR